MERCKQKITSPKVVTKSVEPPFKIGDTLFLFIFHFFAIFLMFRWIMFWPLVIYRNRWYKSPESHKGLWWLIAWSKKRTWKIFVGVVMKSWRVMFVWWWPYKQWIFWTSWDPNSLIIFFLQEVFDVFLAKRQKKPFFACNEYISRDFAVKLSTKFVRSIFYKP